MPSMVAAVGPPSLAMETPDLLFCLREEVAAVLRPPRIDERDNALVGNRVCFGLVPLRQLVDLSPRPLSPRSR